MTPSENRFLERSKRRRPVRVAIAGGGIGGMALALSLHDAGFREVDVYESASSVKELGVGINVLPHATRELTELGLLDELDAVGIPTAELAFYSKHGQRIWSEPRGIRRVPMAAVLHPPRPTARPAPSRGGRTPRP
jgi:2-polyprenyl-6-methoxyphenol hydroxylase-like FAD-dependent oxidoreductase